MFVRFLQVKWWWWWHSEFDSVSITLAYFQSIFLLLKRNLKKKGQTIVCMYPVVTWGYQKMLLHIHDGSPMMSILPQAFMPSLSWSQSSPASGVVLFNDRIDCQTSLPHFALTELFSIGIKLFYDPSLLLHSAMLNKGRARSNSIAFLFSFHPWMIFYLCFFFMPTKSYKELRWCSG